MLVLIIPSFKFVAAHINSGMNSQESSGEDSSDDNDENQPETGNQVSGNNILLN